MRHRKSGKHLNRTSAHRKAMFTNMAASLIEHELIKTTTVKAKELRRKVEPLITLAKEDSVANRRLAFARLRSKPAVGKLFAELGPRYKSRPGGYTRILKAGYRHGDATMVAYVELVDRPRPDYDEEDIESTEPVASTVAEPEAPAPVEEPKAEVVEVEEKPQPETSEATEAQASTTESTAEAVDSETTSTESDAPQSEESQKTEEAKPKGST